MKTHKRHSEEVVIVFFECEFSWIEPPSQRSGRHQHHHRAMADWGAPWSWALKATSQLGRGNLFWFVTSQIVLEILILGARRIYKKKREQALFYLKHKFTSKDRFTTTIKSFTMVKQKISIVPETLLLLDAFAVIMQEHLPSYVGFAFCRRSKLLVLGRRFGMNPSRLVSDIIESLTSSSRFLLLTKHSSFRTFHRSGSSNNRLWNSKQTKVLLVSTA